MQEKTCTKCSVTKPLEEFYKDKRTKDGHRCQCKQCQSEYNKSNREYRRNYMKTYRQTDTFKEYYSNNKESINEKSRQYHKEHRESIRKNKRQYESHKLKTDIDYRIAKNIRGRIRQLLHGNSKSKSTMELLGCSIETLKEHLQQTAIDNGYTNFDINTYSTDEYHMDHVIPCSNFDLSDPDEQAQCFHYTNLQILTAQENLSKGDRVGN